MKTNYKKIIGIVLIIFGSFFFFTGLMFAVVFLGVGNIMEKNVTETNSNLDEFKKNGAVECVGVVIDQDDNYGQTDGTCVQYYVESEDCYYYVSLNVESSEYGIGKEITVYYDPENPDDCMVPDLVTATYGIIDNVFSGIGGILGTVFIVIGLTFFVIGIVLRKIAK